MAHHIPTGVDSLSIERRYELLVNSIHDYAIYMLAPDGTIASWNQGAQRFKGYSADEIIGQNFSRFYSPEDREAGLPVRGLRIAREQGAFEGEGWRVRKDGKRFWAYVIIDPILDADGGVLGFAKVTRDLTERKKAQDALHNSEQQFGLLVNSVTDYAIYMLSPSGHVSSWNAGAQRIKGYTKDEAVGLHFSSFYTEDDRLNKEPRRALETAAREGRYEKEAWRLRKDGSQFWANVVIDPVRDDSGTVIGFAKITRDITERVQAAQALERAQIGLAHAQKMEAVGQLTGGVAHDFNNLLTVIVNSLELLSRTVVTPAETRYLRSAQNAAERGAKLTQQLLAFSRRQPLHQKSHNLNALIGRFESILRRACDEKIKFSLQIDAQIWPVLLDASQFEAALLNLVVNARDAMPDGGRIEITTANVQLDEHCSTTVLKPGNYVKVAVSDMGCGMPPEILQRAYEPFFTTKEVGKGTGLGLSQVYGFVTQSGGDVRIDSRTGDVSGTTISLYFPATAETARPDESSSSPEPLGKVLIVEDEPDVLDMSAEIFRSMGYDVMTAANGHDAIEVLKRTDDIDVLFTDVVMPKGMTGVDLARFTRQLHPQIDIILASGYPIPLITQEHGAIDEFAFISKPYRWSELLQKMRLLQGKRVH